MSPSRAHPTNRLAKPREHHAAHADVRTSSLRGAVSARHPDPDGPISRERADEIGRLYEQHAQELNEALARHLGGDRQLAEEALSTIFARLIAHPETDLSSEADALSWISAAARREALTMRRRETQNLSLDQLVEEHQQTIDELLESPHDTEQLVENRERLAQLDELVAINKHALTANALGYTEEEIAEQAGSTPSAAKGRLVTARRQVRALDEHRQSGAPATSRPTFKPRPSLAYDPPAFTPLTADAPELSVRQQRISGRRAFAMRDDLDLTLGR